jgi:hypothetical protein
VGVGSSDLFGPEGVLCSPLTLGYSTKATLTQQHQIIPSAFYFVSGARHYRLRLKNQSAPATLDVVARTIDSMRLSVRTGEFSYEFIKILRKTVSTYCRVVRHDDPSPALNQRHRQRANSRNRTFNAQPRPRPARSPAQQEA